MLKHMEKLPLISVIVLTYNSSEFVLSTLESIKRQTYAGAIELIIGDDCSQDDSVQICEAWIAQHKSSFARALVHCPAENQGVVANINSCIKISRGEWIKVISGDDILTDDALATLYQAATEGPEIHRFVNSAMYSFQEDKQINQPEQLELLSGGKQDATTTLTDIFKKPNFWTNAPTFFIARSLLEEIGHFPAMFRNIEDRPMFATVLSKGHSIYTTATPTVFYRNNPASISNTAGSYRFAECNWRVYREILRPAFSTLQAIDMDMRMLPHWCLMKRKKKDLITKVFKLGCKLCWVIYRACTFPFTIFGKNTTEHRA